MKRPMCISAMPKSATPAPPEGQDGGPHLHPIHPALRFDRWRAHRRCHLRSPSSASFSQHPFLCSYPSHSLVALQALVARCGPRCGWCSPEPPWQTEAAPCCCCGLAKSWDWMRMPPLRPADLRGPSPHRRLHRSSTSAARQPSAALSLAYRTHCKWFWPGRVVASCDSVSLSPGAASADDGCGPTPSRLSNRPHHLCPDDHLQHHHCGDDGHQHNHHDDGHVT